MPLFFIITTLCASLIGLGGYMKAAYVEPSVISTPIVVPAPVVIETPVSVVPPPAPEPEQIPPPHLLLLQLHPLQSRSLLLFLLLRIVTKWHLLHHMASKQPTTTVQCNSRGLHHLTTSE